VGQSPANCCDAGKVSISFAVQGHPTTVDEWVGLARRAEALGFEALSTADHPGLTAAPFVALAVVAQVTARMQLAPSVINAAAWEPLALAAEVATLDVLSDGRAVLGIGAGHTPKEWTQVGKMYPSASERVEHLGTVVATVRRLLCGETVTVDRETVRLSEAGLGWPKPARDNVPVLMGGNGRRLVRLAAQHADILELTGLGRTLPDGHHHEANWSSDAVDERVRLLRQAGGPAVQVGALVQHVAITNDRAGAADAYRTQFAEVLPEHALPALDDILDTPFVLLGTEDEIVQQLQTHERRWGLNRYTTRADVLDEVGRVIERLV
jgi:probable F420-dependent oxidoreductase